MKQSDVPLSVTLIDPTGNPIKVRTRSGGRDLEPILRFRRNESGQIVPISGSARWQRIEDRWSWKTDTAWLKRQRVALADVDDLFAPPEPGESLDDLERRLRIVEANIVTAFRAIRKMST